MSKLTKKHFAMIPMIVLVVVTIAGAMASWHRTAYVMSLFYSLNSLFWCCIVVLEWKNLE